MRFWVVHFIFVVFGFGWRYTDIIRINESYSNATNYEYGILALGRKNNNDFSEKNIAEMYDHGYVFTRIGKGVMHQTRSVRVDLAKFELTSENREC